MKLQHLTVIFAIIFLPIIIITSYYIQKQVDTIDLQLSYDSKLLDATYDALTAFEINTANEDLSTVSDQLRSIVEASNNIFFNTLATNMGISNANKSYVQPYIPAILYTLYDGYYIYSPTSSPVVCTNEAGETIDTSCEDVRYVGTINVSGKTIGIYEYSEGSGYTVTYSDLSDSIKTEYGQLLYKNKNGTWSTELHEGCTESDYDTKYTQSYMLKSYVSYTAEYSSGNIDVTINYTLDNFISISGTIGDIYYTKSGYLIASDLVTNVTVNDETIAYNTYSEEEIEELIADDSTTIVVTLSDGTTIKTTDGYTTNSTNQDCKDAVEYYVESWMFSEWVYANLGGLVEGDIQNAYQLSSTNLSGVSTTGESSLIYDFRGDTDAIFDGSDPEDDESAFAEHKRNVIKNSIMYNLSLAMVSYSQTSTLTDFEMPIISEEEWDSILANVSMVAFMQGLSCGLKYYNNYAVATSTNNEVTVTPSEIYYVAADESTVIDEDASAVADGTATIETAHRIDCENLEDSDYYLSFKSKEIKYDKIYDSTLGTYDYDHKVYLDYSCIVNGNYWITASSSSSSTTTLRGNSDLLTNLTGNTDKIKAYRIAVAKERNNLYKAVEFSTNYGWKIFNQSTINIPSGEYLYDNGYTSWFYYYSSASAAGNNRMCDIYKIEIVISNIERNPDITKNSDATSSNYTTDTLEIACSSRTSGNTTPSSGWISSDSISLSLDEGTTTRTFYINSTSTSNINRIYFRFKNGSSATIESIKFYYK